MSEIINDGFTKDLTKVLVKHNRTISYSKEGIMFPKQDGGSIVLICRATSATEKHIDKLILVKKI